MIELQTCRRAIIPWIKYSDTWSNEHNRLLTFQLIFHFEIFKSFI